MIRQIEKERKRGGIGVKLQNNPPCDFSQSGVFDRPLLSVFRPIFNPIVPHCEEGTRDAQIFYHTSYLTGTDRGREKGTWEDPRK